MVNSCYLCNKKESRADNISLHRFPKNLDIRKKWLNACGLTTNDDARETCICSRHFRAEDIRQSKIFGSVKSFIKCNAVPILTDPLKIEEIYESPSPIPLFELFEGNKAANQSSSFLPDNNTVGNINVLVLDTMEKEPETFIELNSIEVQISNKSSINSDVVDSNGKSDANRCIENRMVDSSSDDENIVLDKNNSPSQCQKRKFFEPRYVSEILPSDFATPKIAKRTIHLINTTDKKKSQKIKHLQKQTRVLTKRVQSLQDLVKHLKENRMLTDKSGDTLMAHFDDSRWVQNHAAGRKKLKPNTLPIQLNETEVFQICRICLKVDDDLIDLFKPMLNNREPYLELMECTSLQVSSDDGLPPYICKDCFETLQTIKNFKEKYSRSNNLMKNYNGPNKIENLNDYILSKTQTKDIWYIDNGDDFETTTVDKQHYKEETEQLNNKNGDIPVQKTKREEYSVCYICGKKVVKLNSHLNSHNDSLDYKCEICGKQFRTSGLHQEHLLVHKDGAKFECGICHKIFAQYAGRKRHIQTVHEQIRPFKCTLCTKSFHQSYTLTVHMVTHTGERKYKCDVEGCTQQYTQRTPLVQHKLRCHSNTYNCSKKLKEKRQIKRPAKCNKSLVSNRKLKKHIEVHTNTIEKQETETENEIQFSQN